MDVLIGVLGLQGDVSEHAEMLKRIVNGKNVKVVKKPEEIKALEGLIIPGGESTTIGKLMVKYGIDRAIKERDNLAIFGTCAGLIVLAKVIKGKEAQTSLKLIDIEVERNAYGRQRESFEADLEIPAVGKDRFRGVFIRAPKILKGGKGVKTLAEFNGSAVLARQDNILVSTFHPELTGDTRIHEYFLGMIEE